MYRIQTVYNYTYVPLQADPFPLICTHIRIHIGDSCCFSFSIGALVKNVESQVPGIYTRSIEIGSNVEEDVLNGFFKNSNTQIDMVCSTLTADEKLKNGFNVIGFSQGGQFWYTVVCQLLTSVIIITKDLASRSTRV